MVKSQLPLPQLKPSRVSLERRRTLLVEVAEEA